MVHYASDYSLVRTLSDAEYMLDPKFADHHPSPSDMGGKYSVPHFSRFRVDAYPADIGPEPLTSVLTGLRQLITAMKEQAVAGDKIALIFYDDHLAWPRVVKLTSDWDYLLSLTDFRSNIGAMGDPFDPSTNEILNPAPGWRPPSATGSSPAGAGMARRPSPTATRP
jgi:hypothetical protein